MAARKKAVASPVSELGVRFTEGMDQGGRGDVNPAGLQNSVVHVSCVCVGGLRFSRVLISGRRMSVHTLLSSVTFPRGWCSYRSLGKHGLST